LSARWDGVWVQSSDSDRCSLYDMRRGTVGQSRKWVWMRGKRRTVLHLASGSPIERLGPGHLAIWRNLYVRLHISYAISTSRKAPICTTTIVAHRIKRVLTIPCSATQLSPDNIRVNYTHA
jgi:hypothetical protein